MLGETMEGTRIETARSGSESLGFSGKPVSPLYFAHAIGVILRRRALLWHLTKRMLRAQYKRSLLGYAWLVLNPLSLLLTLAFVFTQILPHPDIDHPFVLVLSLGLFPWLFFSIAISAATESIGAHAGLVKAVYFPRDFLVIATVLTKLPDLFVGAVFILIALAVLGEPLYWTVIWVPILFLTQLLFTLGLALPLAGLNLFFHDIRFLVGVVLHLWFFLTPVFYSMELVPERFRFAFDLNPMARLVGAYRDVVLAGGSPSVESLLFVSLAGLLALVGGYYLFGRMEGTFADRM
jgi:ABC-2 type transport system permease protein